MGGFVILSDGRAWSAANWAYDALILAIAHDLPSTPDGEAFGAWLRDQTSTVLGPGMGRVDLRELTPHNQRLFARAAQLAYARLVRDNCPPEWHDPRFFPGWRDLFLVLLKLLKSARRRDPPTYNPHMSSLLPSTSDRSGPGWPSGGAA